MTSSQREISRNIHVTPHPGGGWQIIVEGNIRASAKTATQAEAIEKARRLARKRKGKLFIHRSDGKIRKAETPSVKRKIYRKHDEDCKLSVSKSKVYDVFISHASEDKLDVAYPLALVLKRRGLSVWFDSFELKIGDNLRDKIDFGLANSKFGIVVLSRSYLQKAWTNYEFDALMTRSVLGQQKLIPIWHNITNEEVSQYSLSLYCKFAGNTSHNSIINIANEIADLILSANNRNNPNS